MAFMKAQLREYVFTPDDEGRDTREISTIHTTFAKQVGCMFRAECESTVDQNHSIHVDRSELSEDCYERDFLCSSEIDADVFEVVLFNPYKKPEGTVHSDMNEYMPEVDIEYAMDWLVAARQVHMYVERVLDKPVDWTFEDVVCDAYARVFQVNIHLYSYAGNGKRYKSFTCSNMHRHIHLLVDATHVCPITKVEAFMAAHKGSQKMAYYNFCDICTYTTTHNNVNKGAGLKHIESCIATNTDFLGCEMRKANSELTKQMAGARHTTLEHSISCIDCGTVSKTIKKCCERDNHYTQAISTLYCTSCNEELSRETAGTHKCYIRIPEEKERIEDSLLFAFDTEACQTEVLHNRPGSVQEVGKLFTHTCNCLYLKCLYEETPHESKRYCATVHDFMHLVLTEKRYMNSIFFSHNGAAYDTQYILKYAEEHGVVHDVIPHPNSNHKYLELKVYSVLGWTVSFRDFYPLMPGSLKGIGQSFGLEVTKGDFPHGFNRPENQAYVGSIPALHSPHDMYGYTTKKEKRDQMDLQRWFDKESERVCTCVYVEGEYVFTEEERGGERAKVCTQCKKDCWDFQVELRKYCYLDVVVLAESLKLYRETMLTPSFDPSVATMERDGAGLEPWRYWQCPNVDPFQYLTASQIAMNLFLRGFHKEKPLKIASVQYNHRDNYQPLSTGWIYSLNEQHGVRGEEPILYRGNSIREYYSYVTHRFYDGYHAVSNKIYIFRDCAFYGCDCLGYNAEDKHRDRNMDVRTVRKERGIEVWKLEKQGFQVEELWTHQALERGYEEVEVIKDREMLYGGRTEVHHAYFKPEEGFEIKYIDVCSMYPYVCAFKTLPVDHPEVLIGGTIEEERLRETHVDPYWGYVKCRIIPNRGDALGLLPSRDTHTNRLEFNLVPKTGVWHTEEVYLAVRNGYVVDKVFQVYHWSRERRSDSVFRGYVSYFLKQKQESDGWKKAGASSDAPPEEEKEGVIDALCRLNGGIGRMEADKVKVNPVRRALGKLKLNSIWGKFVQGRHEDHFVDLNGYRQYLQFMGQPNLNMKTLVFRHVKDNFFKVKYHRIDEVKPTRNLYNIWLGSGVTAWARCILNEKSLEIGPENLIYSDTDSLQFNQSVANPMVCQKGLGGWQDEKPDEVIESVTVLSPKNYMLKIANKEDLETKSKGVVLHMKNKQKVNQGVLNEMLASKVSMFEGRERVQELMMDNFNIFPNSTIASLPFAQLCSRYNEKRMRSVLTKRQIVQVFNKDEEGDVVEVEMGVNLKRIRLLPFGHEAFEELSEKELSDLYYQFK
jgi:hypothetical protein